jgi:hypothetical protein
VDLTERTAIVKAWLDARPGAVAEPMGEVERLAAGSYDLVCDGLTRKQKAELAGLSGQGGRDIQRRLLSPRRSRERERRQIARPLPLNFDPS